MPPLHFPTLKPLNSLTGLALCPAADQPEQLSKALQVLFRLTAMREGLLLPFRSGPLRQLWQVFQDLPLCKIDIPKVSGNSSLGFFSFLPAPTTTPSSS
jgi:hypothetical protein